MRTHWCPHSERSPLHKHLGNSLRRHSELSGVSLTISVLFYASATADYKIMPINFSESQFSHLEYGDNKYCFIFFTEVLWEPNEAEYTSSWDAGWAGGKGEQEEGEKDWFFWKLRRILTIITVSSPHFPSTVSHIRIRMTSSNRNQLKFGEGDQKVERG